jgi:hypothetical protein
MDIIQIITVIASIVAVLGSLGAVAYTWGSIAKSVSKNERDLNEVESKLDSRLDRLSRVEGRVEVLDKLEARIEQRVDALLNRYISVSERLGSVMHVVYPHLSANQESVFDSAAEIVTKHAVSGNPIEKSDLEKFNTYREKVANKTLTEAEYEDFKKLAKAIEEDLPPGKDKDSFGSLIQDALGFAAGVTFWSLSLPFGSTKGKKDED